MRDTDLYDLAKQFMEERLERHSDQGVAEHIRVNRAQGLQAEKRNIRCRSCGTTTACVRWTDPAGQIADTWGYMEFNEPDGNVCTNCLGEPYMGELF